MSVFEIRKRVRACSLHGGVYLRVVIISILDRLNLVLVFKMHPIIMGHCVFNLLSKVHAFSNIPSQKLLFNYTVFISGIRRDFPFKSICLSRTTKLLILVCIRSQFNRLSFVKPSAETLKLMYLFFIKRLLCWLFVLGVLFQSEK